MISININRHSYNRAFGKILCAVLSVLLASSTFAGVELLSDTRSASAEPATSQEIKDEVAETAEELVKVQQELDKASDDYNAAAAEREAAKKQIQQVSAEIGEYEAEIAEIREKLGTRARNMYRNNQTNIFLDILFGSNSLDEMLDSWNVMETLNENDSQNISRSKEIRSELASKQAEAIELEMMAAERAEQMQALKEEAQSKEAETKAKLDELNEKYRLKVLEEAAAMSGYGISDYAAVSGAARDIPTNGSVIDFAASRLGCPYVWGASGPNSFDCSGLVMWCYAHVGKNLPHNTEAQKSAAKAVIPVSEAEPGDVLYRSGHVGIYIGGGKYIHAPHTGDVVRVASGGNWSAALRF